VGGNFPSIVRVSVPKRNLYPALAGGFADSAVRLATCHLGARLFAELLRDSTHRGKLWNAAARCVGYWANGDIVWDWHCGAGVSLSESLDADAKAPDEMVGVWDCGCNRRRRELCDSGECAGLVWAGRIGCAGLADGWADGAADCIVSFARDVGVFDFALSAVGH